MENISIEVGSTPDNAKIFVDGSDTHKVTPATLHLERKPGSKVTIALKLKGYNTFSRTVDTADSAQIAAELTRVRGSGPVPGTGSAGKTNGSGGKPGGTPGSNADPDGLMRP